MTIYDSLIYKALFGGSGGGGGGGSGDFSTAQVTVTFESEWCPLYAPIVRNDSIFPFPDDDFTSGDTCTVALYKGSVIVYSQNGDITSTSGAIEQYNEYFYKVTGDCTIGITGDT